MVSLLELTLQLSRASDMVSPELNHHQRLVADITNNLGKSWTLMKRN